MTYKILLFIILIFIPLVSVSQTNDSVSVFDLSLEDLLKMEVYSANKKIEPISNIPASIVIISREDIQVNGWQTLEEILQNVPGMYMINDYFWFGTDNFGIRGFFATGSFKTMVVLVNGVNQKEEWYNSSPLTKVNVPVEAIDRIEVIRGPMSVIYGNNALLGAINIITNDANSGNIVKGGGGNNGNYKAFTRLSGEKEDFSYSLNASFYGSNGIDKPYREMMNNPSIISSWNLPLYASTDGQLEDHRRYFNLSMKYKDVYIESSQTMTSRGTVDFQPGVDDGHLAQIQSSNFVFGVDKKLGKNFNLNARIGYYSFRDILNYKTGTDSALYEYNDIYSEAIDAEINCNFKLSPKIEFSVGAYYSIVLRDKLKVDQPLYNGYANMDAGLNRDENKMTWAVYSQITYNISSKLSVMGGLRLEQTPQYHINYTYGWQSTQPYVRRVGTYEYDNVMTIPRGAILYHFSDEHHLKFMYGMAIKQAAIGENMDIVRNPERPQLVPSTMQTFELNYLGIIGDFASISFSLFRNSADKLISRTNSISNGEIKLYNTNSGELITNGSELSIQIKPTSNLNAKFSITYQKSKNLQDGYENIDLGYSPALLTYFSVSYKLLKKSTICLSGYYVDKMLTNWAPDITGVENGHRIGDEVPGYFTLNGNIRFNKIFSDKVFLSAYVYNILNQEIRYPTTTVNDGFDKGTFGYSRYFNVSLGVNF